MSDDLVKRLRDWETVYPEEESEPEGSLYSKAADRIEELEAQLAAKACPLGDDCDLTVAYMAGAEKAKDTMRQQQQRIEELEKQIKTGALQYLSDAGQMQDRIAEVHAKLDRTVATLRRVDAWFDELEMYTAPDYHLAPALQEVKDVLKDMDK